MDTPSSATPRIDFRIDLTLRDVKGNDVQLREGIYGKVVEVEYKGTDLAAQHFRPDLAQEGVKRHEDFLQACHMWSVAARHPNIVRLMGLWYRNDDENSFPAIVSEKMKYNLRSVIESHDGSLNIDFHKKMLILRDVTNGLRYLHSQNSVIVHYGLTPSNILLECSKCCMLAKISNVGVAKMIKIPDNTFDSGFLPPEAASNDSQYGPPFDIFSFGLVFWYTAVNPTLPEAGNKKYNIEFRELQKNFNVSTSFRLLLRSCWDKAPDKRPSIVKLSEAIKDLIHSKHTVQDNRKLRCYNSTDRVDIPLGQSDKQPMTIPQLYKNTFSKVPNEKALCWKGNDDQWQSITYVDYKRLIYSVAKSFHKLKLKPSHSVGIMGSSSVEWFASSIGAVFAGGVSTGIHATNSSEVCQYILKDCKACIVVVENSKLLDTIVEIRGKLPHLLKAIVQYKGELNKDYPDTYTWKEFLELGKDIKDSVIDNIISNQQPNQCAIVLYTSGTTGHPKGVMLSHDNLTWSTMAFLETVGCKELKATKTGISYLSPAHIIGTFTDMFLPIPVGGTVYFANSKNSLIFVMKEVQPTFLFSTPRVWEKIKQNAEAILLEHQNTSRGSKRLSSLAAVIKGLNFEKFKYISAGGEQMHKDTLNYFYKMNLTVLGHYGMTESTSLQTTNLEGARKFGSCGRSLKGVQVDVVNKDEYKKVQLLSSNQPKSDIGEVVCRGRNVFMGYLGNEEKTNETIDDERWLHSGDLGWLDDEKFLHIICRIDDLIKMAGGEWVVPIEIEECIKSEIEFLSNVVLIGDKREHLTCLLTLKCVVDPDTGEATDALHPQVIKVFKEDLGTDCTTVSQVIETKNQTVFKAIQDGIDRYNKKYTCSDIQKVRGWRLLQSDFTVSGGELGPVLKLKRSIVVQTHAETIEELYGNAVEGHILKNHEVCDLKDVVPVSQRCTNYGKVIEIEDHNVTVTIPQGAIEKSYSVEVEVAVSLFGSYELPQGYTRISPYVWIGASYTFKKPLKIEIEHHASVSKDADILQLCVMEAYEENRNDHHTDEDVMREAIEVYSSHCEISSSFYTYRTHSKFTCLAKKSVKIADEVAVYQFLPKNYTELENFIVEICFCCNLKFLRKLINDIYEKRNMVKDDHNYSTMKLVDNQELQLHLLSKEIHGWNVSHLGYTKMSASKIVYLRFQDSRGITREVDKHNYPPCFRVKVNRRNFQTQLDVNFDICVPSAEVLSTLNLFVPVVTPVRRTDEFLSERLDLTSASTIEPIEEEGSQPIDDKLDISGTILKTATVTSILPKQHELYLKPDGSPMVKKADRLTIIHFNDVYNIDPRKENPGAARFATKVKELGWKSPLVLFSGDALSPSSISTVTRGEHMIPILNALNVKAAVFGNHDFDFGVENLTNVAKFTSFPWLMSNVVDKLTNRPLAEGLVKHIIEWEGIKIGLIGLVELDWLKILSTVSPDDVLYTDYVECAKMLVPQLTDEGCNLIIALTHMRMPNDERLAKSVGEIDIILGGYDHCYEVKVVNDVHVLKSGSDFKEFSEVTVTFTADKPSFDIRRHKITPDIKEDEEVKAVVTEYLGLIEKSKDGVIGHINCPLEGRYESTRTEECNLDIGSYVEHSTGAEHSTSHNSQIFGEEES